MLSHHTAPGVESRVLAPKSLAISFDLELTWSQDTFDSPHQMWQATSRYNLKVCGAELRRGAGIAQWLERRTRD